MAKLGNTMKAYISVSSSYTWLTGEQSNSVNMTADAIEVSDKSTDWRQYIAGCKSGTIVITVFADNDDTVQKATIAAFRAGDVVDVFIGVLSGNTPQSGDAGNAIITAVSDTNDFGAVSTRNLSLQITGSLSHYELAD